MIISILRLFFQLVYVGFLAGQMTEKQCRLNADDGLMCVDYGMLMPT